MSKECAKISVSNIRFLPGFIAIWEQMLLEDWPQKKQNGRHAGAGDGGCANSKPFQAAAQRWTQQLRVAFSRAPKRASTEIEMLLLSSTGDHVMLARFILIRSALQFCTWYRLPSRHVGRGVCTRPCDTLRVNKSYRPLHPCTHTYTQKFTHTARRLISHPRAPPSTRTCFRATLPIQSLRPPPTTGPGVSCASPSRSPTSFRPSVFL